MKLSEQITILENWMSMFADGCFRILETKSLTEETHLCRIMEHTPAGPEIYQIVVSDGNLYTSNGDNLVATCLDAYDYDPKFRQRIDDFVKKNGVSVKQELTPQMRDTVRYHCKNQ